MTCPIAPSLPADPDARFLGATASGAVLHVVVVADAVGLRALMAEVGATEPLAAFAAIAAGMVELVLARDEAWDQDAWLEAAYEATVSVWVDHPVARRALLALGGLAGATAALALIADPAVRLRRHADPLAFGRDVVLACGAALVGPLVEVLARLDAIVGKTKLRPRAA